MTITNYFSTIAFTLFATGVLFTGCQADKQTYSEGERVLFADTLAAYPVLENETEIDIPVASTVRRDYDRTFGVEIVDQGSTAIENRHYRLVSSSITIKAGETAANVRLQTVFDAFGPADSLGVILRLVMPDQLAWDAYSNQTKVVFRKFCQLQLEDWTADGGNYIFYATFPYESLTRVLVKAEAMPDGERLRFKSLLGDNFDLTMRFYGEDPTDPVVEVLPQRAFYASNYGVVTTETASGTPNYYYACDKYTVFYLTSYSENVGIFGTYMYMLEWITQKEADYYANYGFGQGGF